MATTDSTPESKPGARIVLGLLAGLLVVVCIWVGWQRRTMRIRQSELADFAVRRTAPDPDREPGEYVGREPFPPIGRKPAENRKKSLHSREYVS